MKIAVMLAIHNHPEQANVFIGQCLTDPECEVFIHIDKKGLAIRPMLIKDSRVHVLPRSFSVDWGEFSQVQYVLYMMEYIQAYGDFAYYSIHSGSDLVVRPMRELQAFLEETDRYAYLNCHLMPWSRMQYGGGMGRLRMIWPRWMRKRLKIHSVRRCLRAIYGRLYFIPFLRVRKLPEGVDFYGNSAWYTLRRDCVGDVLEYVRRNPGFTEFFRPVLCGDEIFFNTVVAAAAGEKGMTGQVCFTNNLLFDELFYKDNNYAGAPKTLTVKDIDAIRESGAFFARKADPGVDREIIEYYDDLIRK